MRTTFTRVAAASLLLATMAAPAFAGEHKGNAFGKEKNAGWFQLLSEQRDARKAFKAELRVAKEAEKPADAACVKPAIEKREIAIGSAFDAYSASVKSALSTRRTALAAVWSLTDVTARQTALTSAWRAYKDSSSAAKRTLRDAKETAWRTYHTERKTCGAAVPGDVTTSSVDSLL